jgi:hypothetical protein
MCTKRWWSNITWTCKQAGRKQEEDHGDTEKRTSRLVEAKKMADVRRQGGGGEEVLVQF